MYSYNVKWKVRSNGSSVKDSQHSANVTANSEDEAIEKVKQNNPSSRDRMYDFEVRRIR